MKKLFAILAVAAILVSCNDSTSTSASSNDSDSAKAAATADSISKAANAALADTLKK